MTIEDPKLHEKHPLENLLQSRKFKAGVFLFTLYALAYAIFTIVGTFYNHVFRADVFGLNVGILYGKMLIIGAIIMAVGFNWFAGRMEKEEEQEAQ